jgi:teichuronic acid biosynthesis glycosyltransferase TuaH
VSGLSVASEEPAHAAVLADLVVCSLESWDDIWRRNQFFVDALLRRHPQLRVLFVEPPADPLHDTWSRRLPSLPRLRRLSHEGRLWTIRPLKPLPRACGPFVDGIIRRQLLVGARAVGITQPILWINDVTYAPLIERTGWPSLYDVTDDWLLAPASAREHARLRRLDQLALTHADQVVVCSPALAASRGAGRSVSLIPNAVDVRHLRSQQPRPADLPRSPVAIYVGSLHDARLDIDLVCEVASAISDVTFVFVGPDALSRTSRERLNRLPNVRLLGPRPYSSIPAYLQHADAVVVPHRRTPFTESLDPIKAYECLAVDTPTVATPVAGFREHDLVLDVVEPSAFAHRLAEVLGGNIVRRERSLPDGWDERSLAFEAALVAATAGQTSE